MKIEEGIKKALDLIIQEGKKKLVEKDLITNRGLIDSLESTVYKMGEDFVGDYTGLGYGLIQERGIKKENIPYGNGSGFSLYIEALIKWVKDRGFASDVVRTKGIAFAIAKTHKRLGMHTTGGVGVKNGSQFNPSKQGWLSESINLTENQVDEIIYAAMDDHMDRLITIAIEESLRNTKIN